MASCLRSDGLEMDFLDEDQSWNLLRKKVFGQQQECPLELEEIGRRIARNCKGLPLSIVIIAGLLKSNMTQEYWHGVSEKVSSIVSQADDGHCSKILSLSYVNLPVHLKPCFLYIGVFPEDYEIKVSRLIRLWVAEGFLKLNKVKSPEEVAKDYLMDLIDRNIIMVHKQGRTGKLKYFKIHDLIRDICIREAETEKFFCVVKSLDSPQVLQNQRRIVLENFEIEQKFPTSLLLRSVTCVYPGKLDLSFICGRLIRVLNGYSKGSSENNVNLRYIEFWGMVETLDSGNLWNIQTIKFHEEVSNLNIWEMKQLRHLFHAGSYQLLECVEEDANVLLPHLETLKGIMNLTLTEGVIRRISNVKKLRLEYDSDDEEKDYYLSNLQHLNKLESLQIVWNLSLQPKLCFPDSLKKLFLEGTYLHWEDMPIIGSLPNLQLLKLEGNAFVGVKWNPIEEQFISLRYLEIDYSIKFGVWNAGSIHFPVLETLILSNLITLKEIPLDMGEITTLRCIQLYRCSDSVVMSAMDILDDQESLGNTDIKVKVTLRKEKTQLQTLEAKDNLELHIY